MSGSAPKRGRWALAGVAVGVAVALQAIPVSAVEARPALPSPYDILGTRHLQTPVVDPIGVCIPDRLPSGLRALADLAEAGEWQRGLELIDPYLTEAKSLPAGAEILGGSLAARAAADPRAMRLARKRLRRALAGQATPDARLCGLLELARLDLHLRQLPEAAAQLARVDRLLTKLADSARRAEERRFYGAEIHYRSHRAFEAHVAFRSLSHSENSRLAAASRLRLTDLSFDAGKSDAVRVEYEALLPRAKAFGASIFGWSLRAAEASLDAGDYDGAAAWLKRYTDVVRKGRERAVVEIRQADVEALSGDGRAARARLLVLARRIGDSELAALARIRAIDLGIGPPQLERRQRALRAAAAVGHPGVSAYALGVMLHEALAEGDVDAGLGTAARLAYHGASRILAPHFDADLDQLLVRASARAESESECLVLARRLGGRYGLLIRRTPADRAFLALGGCFEKLGLPSLAVSVYHSVVRTFGARSAERAALPLARASLAAGDTPVVRAAAEAHLRHTGAESASWRLLLAEVQQREGRHEAAASLLQPLVAGDAPGGRRLHAALLLARSLDRREATAADRALLTGVLAGWSESPGSRRADALGEALLLLAAATRRAGQADAAVPLYARVPDAIPSGPLPAEALYWEAQLSNRSERALERFRRAAAVERGGPWSSLARFEVGLWGLDREYGEPES